MPFIFLIVCVHPHYLLVQEVRLVDMVRSLCYSSLFCAFCGVSPIKICMIGYRIGPHWHWLADSQRAQMGLRSSPSPSQQCKRAKQAGAPLPETLFVVCVRLAIGRHLIRARDLIIDSAPILAWHRADPDAAWGHAPAQHPRPLLRGYRVHTLICRGSGLPLHFLLSPANVHDSPFAQQLLQWAFRLYNIHPRVIRLDAAYWGLKLIFWIHSVGLYPSG